MTLNWAQPPNMRVVSSITIPVRGVSIIRWRRCFRIDHGMMSATKKISVTFSACVNAPKCANIFDSFSFLLSELYHAPMLHSGREDPEKKNTHSLDQKTSLNVSPDNFFYNFSPYSSMLAYSDFFDKIFGSKNWSKSLFFVPKYIFRVCPFIFQAVFEKWVRVFFDHFSGVFDTTM